MHVVCTDLLCVVCIGLLSVEFSTVNTGLGRPMFWKPLCLLSTSEGLATTLHILKATTALCCVSQCAGIEYSWQTCT